MNAGRTGCSRAIAVGGSWTDAGADGEYARTAAQLPRYRPESDADEQGVLGADLPGSAAPAAL
ncbi:hypothetical protein [Actinomadura chokoriensis]|uniref:Uncharacterized protein n=1 Tax=Actinomadura chokoriensis TaxID=454156 RepID=A0ABV4R2P2_9ACTN